MIAGNLTILQEEHKDYKSIVSLILRSFNEGTDYSYGTDIIAIVEEIRDSKYYIPQLSFVAELDGKVVGHFMFSHFPLSDVQRRCLLRQRHVFVRTNTLLVEAKPPNLLQQIQCLRRLCSQVRIL